MALPVLDYGDIYLTSGYVKYNEELQYLEWYHSRDPTLPEDENETTQGISTETIIIKNNSGSLEDSKLVEERCVWKRDRMSRYIEYIYI